MAKPTRLTNELLLAHVERELESLMREIESPTDERGMRDLDIWFGDLGHVWHLRAWLEQRAYRVWLYALSTISGTHIRSGELGRPDASARHETVREGRALTPHVIVESVKAILEHIDVRELFADHVTLFAILDDEQRVLTCLGHCLRMRDEHWHEYLDAQVFLKPHDVDGMATIHLAAAAHGMAKRDPLTIRVETPALKARTLERVRETLIDVAALVREHIEGETEEGSWAQKVVCGRVEYLLDGHTSSKGLHDERRRLASPALALLEAEHGPVAIYSPGAHHSPEGTKTRPIAWPRPAYLFVRRGCAYAMLRGEQIPNEAELEMHVALGKASPEAVLSFVAKDVQRRGTRVTANALGDDLAELLPTHVVMPYGPLWRCELSYVFRLETWRRVGDKECQLRPMGAILKAAPDLAPLEVPASLDELLTLVKRPHGHQLVLTGPRGHGLVSGSRRHPDPRGTYALWTRVRYKIESGASEGAGERIEFKSTVQTFFSIEDGLRECYVPGESVLCPEALAIILAARTWNRPVKEHEVVEAAVRPLKELVRTCLSTNEPKSVSIASLLLFLNPGTMLVDDANRTERLQEVARVAGAVDVGLLEALIRNEWEELRVAETPKKQA